MRTRDLQTVATVRLDVENQWVWQGERLLRLTPKAFAVLDYLVKHAGRLVSKDELLTTVWPQTVVSEGVLTTCIREIRRELGEEAKKTRYIETMHRRGYRFIGPLASAPAPAPALGHPPSADRPLPARRLVGREAELKQLQGALDKALTGARQIVFVTGEAGIGKTTVVEEFVERAAAEKNLLWIASGQCVEHYGASEAYLPVLEALGRLCRAPQNKQLITLLRQYAPTWLGQMPWLLKPAELAELQCQGGGFTRERMLREMAEAVEAVTEETPLVLVLEDLHWSDYATLDLLASLARRRESARLLVIGTYRPMEVIVRGHPLQQLKQELQVHGQCAELRLEALTEAAVTEYLAARFPPRARAVPLEQLARFVNRRTEGNPLFMIHTVAYLTAQHVLNETPMAHGETCHGAPLKPLAEAERGMPETLQQMIRQQIERLSVAEQQLLEVASVVGAEFSAAAVAAGLEITVEAVEEQCEALVRRKQFLAGRENAEWPDGTVAAHYGFRHVLYQEVLSGRLTAKRRMRLHQAIGERLEQAYGERSEEIAAELAVHFEEGRDYGRAARYLQQAAEKDIRRSAHREAIDLLRKGLELLKILVDPTECAQHELALQITLGSALTAAKGYTAPEVERAYARARELCRTIGETPQLFLTLWGLWGFYCMRAELQTAYELAQQLLTTAERTQSPAFLVGAHQALGFTLLHLGRLAPARAHLEQGIALCESRPHGSLAFLYGQDPGVACRVGVATVLWFLGYPQQAMERLDEAMARSQALAHPFTQAFVLHEAVWMHCARGEIARVVERCEALAQLGAVHGFALAQGTPPVMEGWILAVSGQAEAGIAQIRQSLAAAQPIVMQVMLPVYLGLLADACLQGERIDEGLSALAEAFAEVERPEEHFYAAELYRLKGDLTLKSSRSRSAESKAEECFRRAIAIARQQGARSLELRAAVSLSQLWEREGKDEEARLILEKICGWFTEGFDVADWRKAMALLEELSCKEMAD